MVSLVGERRGVSFVADVTSLVLFFLNCRLTVSHLINIFYQKLEKAVKFQKRS